MVQGFSKPPPSATRPPLRVLKPLENKQFPVNSQNAVGAVGAVDSGSRRYKKANSTFALWSWAIPLIAPFVVLAVSTLALLAGDLLWHAPRCTGPTQADVCPLAASKAAVSNTKLDSYRRD